MVPRFEKKVKLDSSRVPKQCKNWNQTDFLKKNPIPVLVLGLGFGRCIGTNLGMILGVTDLGVY